MLAWRSATGPLGLQSQAGLEARQRGAPVAVLTWLFLILHLLSISPKLLMLGQRRIVAQLESFLSPGARYTLLDPETFGGTWALGAQPVSVSARR